MNAGGTEEDPLSPDNIGTIQFITQARIYDVLMAILTKMDEKAGSELLELHSQGHLLANAPVLSGTFIADEDEQSQQTMLESANNS